MANKESVFLTEEMDQLAEIGSGNVSKPPTYEYKNGKWVATNGSVPHNNTSTAKTSGYGTQLQYKSTMCYHKNDFAFHTQGRNIQFYGSTGFDAEPELFDIVFDLNNGTAIGASKRPVTTFITSGPDSFLELNSLCKKAVAPVINLAWPDMHIPKGITTEFWQGLLDLIPDDSNVLVSCTGGHGRTGSFLAIMLGLLEGLDGTTAIDYIRQLYCSKAIETTAQEQYIKEILNANVQKS